MGLRIGADVGGTFTDIVIELADGSYASTKVLTTYQAPELGILDGISQIAAEAGIDLSDVEQIIHGTTLATNALIQRSGARTALVTTDGFRDVIETRTESRFEQYDLNIVLPRALDPTRRSIHRHRTTQCPRPRTRGIRRGRCLPTDHPHRLRTGYESVAVGFIHSYLNPVNERRFREHAPGRAPRYRLLDLERGLAADAGVRAL